MRNSPNSGAGSRGFRRPVSGAALGRVAAQPGARRRCRDRPPTDRDAPMPQDRESRAVQGASGRAGDRVAGDRARRRRDAPAARAHPGEDPVHDLRHRPGHGAGVGRGDAALGRAQPTGTAAAGRRTATERARAAGGASGVRAERRQEERGVAEDDAPVVDVVFGLAGTSVPAEYAWALVARDRALAAVARRRAEGGHPPLAHGADRLRRGAARESREARRCGCPASALPDTLTLAGADARRRREASSSSGRGWPGRCGRGRRCMRAQVAADAAGRGGVPGGGRRWLRRGASPASSSPAGAGR